MEILLHFTIEFASNITTYLTSILKNVFKSVLIYNYKDYYLLNNVNYYIDGTSPGSDYIAYENTLYISNWTLVKQIQITYSGDFVDDKALIYINGSKTVFGSYAKPFNQTFTIGPCEYLNIRLGAYDTEGGGAIVRNGRLNVHIQY